ncbi:MAG: hypothetical protein LH491_06340 [Pseudoxanthomonas sp.]|nr:hypothetical protein [Pseudoxanthomonas sp.]
MPPPDKLPGERIEPSADWAKHVEFHARRSPPPAARVRRAWPWALLVAAVLVLGVILLRAPLANLLWPETRVQRMLDDAETALRAGQLSAADGSGARQRFEAAQALDSDRIEARQGLVRVAAAALAQAGKHIEAGQQEQARAALALARELQAPRQQVEAMASRLRGTESTREGAEKLMAEAIRAQSAGELEIALPLLQRVLVMQPNHTQALEFREDALSELLQQAQSALARDQLAPAAQRVQQVRGFDPGHAGLPEMQARLAAAVEQRRLRADADLSRQRLDDALAGYRLVLQVSAADPAALQGAERVAAMYAKRATREAADFDFDAAESLLQQARAIVPSATAVKEAEQALARARQSQSRLASSLPPAQRARRVQELLAAMAEAEARTDWLTPPGESAYDHLRAAQALAPDEPGVKRAAARFVPAIRTCFETELRSNRIRRADACYEAWGTIEPRDPRLPPARRALASKWIAVGGERLGAGEISFAVQALAEATELDTAAPGLQEFSQRVRLAQDGGN